MKLETPGTKNKRQAILRGVYEDNLKMTKKAARLQRPRFLWVWGTRVAVVLAGFLIVLGGFQVYQEIQAKQRSNAVVLSPAERIAQQFGNADDPGLRSDRSWTAGTATAAGCSRWAKSKFCRGV